MYDYIAYTALFCPALSRATRLRAHPSASRKIDFAGEALSATMCVRMCLNRDPRNSNPFTLQSYALCGPWRLKLRYRSFMHVHKPFLAAQRLAKFVQQSAAIGTTCITHFPIVDGESPKLWYGFVQPSGFITGAARRAPAVGSYGRALGCMWRWSACSTSKVRGLPCCR